ncbi:hypothetical protein ACI3PL_31945, partial [Lacticaseibacillus paracasei]
MNKENQELFDRVLDTIKTNHVNHVRGNVNCIPFQNFTRLEDLIVGIEKSSYYCITAGTGIGKSRLT